jgi:hypothetical protein
VGSLLVKLFHDHLAAENFARRAVPAMPVRSYTHQQAASGHQHPPTHPSAPSKLGWYSPESPLPPFPLYDRQLRACCCTPLPNQFPAKRGSTPDGRTTRTSWQRPAARRRTDLPTARISLMQTMSYYQRGAVRMHTLNRPRRHVSWNILCLECPTTIHRLSSSF